MQIDALYNPLSNETLDNPYPIFDYLRKNHPVYWHEQMNSWVLTRHADCRSVLRNHEIWARDRRRIGEKIEEQYISMQSIDPPDVASLRGGFLAAYKSVDSSNIAKISYDAIRNNLLPLVGREQVCFMKDFALPVSEIITCAVFGLELPGNDIFHDIGYGIALQMDSGLVPEQRWEGRKIESKLRALVDQGFSLRKEGGLFGAVNKQFENTEWPQILLSTSMAAMLNAAYSTMYTTLGNTALALIRNPEVLSQINSENLALAADEFIRFDSPAQGTSRFATEETSIGDVQFKRGDIVITMFAAANHDPQVFTHPTEINVNRKPNPHLGFGFGTHACLGINLALTVLQQFLANMITLPPLNAVGEPKRFRTATLRWLETLPTAFQSEKLKKTS